MRHCSASVICSQWKHIRRSPEHTVPQGLCCWYSTKKDMSHPMASSPSVDDVEGGWYEWWASNSFFKHSCAAKKFVMVLPPPNVTGKLHIGHALTCSIQDALARWHHMQGHEVTWVPGCDHAGIATQVVVEKHLWETLQLSRLDLGRRRFVEEVWNWKEEKGDVIYRQMRRLGVALDWPKATFTMDEKMNLAVKEAFIHLHEAGLIYRGKYMINWCCALQSTVSDSEVEYISIEKPTKISIPGSKQKFEFGKIYNIGYKLENEGHILIVRTTRPETVIGDTAVMVHPEDSRYQSYIGKNVVHPFRSESIPVIADTSVNPEFGTGVVKVTPAHDFKDYDVGTRHNLPFLNILSDDGCLNNTVQEFEHIPRFRARELVLESLEKKGLYFGCHIHPMTLPVCSRTGDVIEPMIKSQWFIRMGDMSKRALKAVLEKELTLHPSEPHTQLWDQWLSQEKDWCISRQLWWGHRIPVYRVTSAGSNRPAETWVAAHSFEEAKKKSSRYFGCDDCEILSVEQDKDVLDTWFSSALFPFAVFGWPHDTEELKSYYPTSLLETGHDILFFWVARMVMLGLQLTGKLPFKEVLLHGLVCDTEGHKMSKSKGNVIDPMDVIDGVSSASSSRDILKCGADALRFTLCSMNFKQKIVTLNMAQVEQNYYFRNKLWQTIRFLRDHAKRSDPACLHMKMVDREKICDLSVMDRWILSRLASHIIDSYKNFAEYDIHLVCASFRQFWYDCLCDVYLEAVKPRLWNDDNPDDIARVLSTLWTCCFNGILTLSPFMPFLSEELYQRLPSSKEKCDSVFQEQFPAADEWIKLQNLNLEEDISLALDIAASIRSLRKAYNFSANKAYGEATVLVHSQDVCGCLRAVESEITRLSFLTTLHLKENQGTAELPRGFATSTVREGIQVSLHLQDAIDPVTELSRLHKKTMKLEKEFTKVVNKMESPKYAELTPEEVKHRHQQKISVVREEIKEIRKMIETLNALL